MWKTDNTNGPEEKFGKSRDEMDREIEETAKRKGLPVIPRRPPPRDKRDDAVAVCGECGKIIRSVEHYCCMNNNCPLKPFTHL